MSTSIKEVLVVGLVQCAPGFEALFPDRERYRFLDKDSDEWASRGPLARAKLASEYRVVHYFWGKVKPAEALCMLARGVRVITHFVGSDVTHVLKRTRKRATQRLYNRIGFTTAVVHENLAAEFATANIQCKVVPFVSRDLSIDLPPWPAGLRVLCYVPEGREEFFNLPWIQAAAAARPDIDFTVFPHRPIDGTPENLRFEPWIPFEEMPAAIAGHHALLRLPAHDGLPQTRFEALASARHVLWTFDGEHTQTIRSAGELLDALDQVKAEGPNLAGREYVLREYSMGVMRKRYLDLWEEVSRSGAVPVPTSSSTP